MTPAPLFVFRLSLKVDVDVEEPLGMVTEVGVMDPPVALRFTVIVVPKLLTTGFWNWSIITTLAVIELPTPFALLGEMVHANDDVPTVPVHDTAAAVPESMVTLVKLRPAAVPAVTVSAEVVPHVVPPLFLAVMVGVSAFSSP
jgi:hypothetical protein